MFVMISVHHSGDSYPIATASTVEQRKAFMAVLEASLARKEAIRDILYQWKRDAEVQYPIDDHSTGDDRMTAVIVQHRSRELYFEHQVRTLHDPWLELVILENVHTVEWVEVPHFDPPTHFYTQNP